LKLAETPKPPLRELVTKLEFEISGLLAERLHQQDVPGVSTVRVLKHRQLRFESTVSRDLRKQRDYLWKLLLNSMACDSVGAFEPAEVRPRKQLGFSRKLTADCPEEIGESGAQSGAQ